MRLICNNVALELYSGATLSFKKTNPLFAFDALTCERTQAFDIPATPNNERVFGLAKLPAYNGDGMRRRFDAELQDGTVVKRGFLYVDKYNGKNYNAIFVTGELYGLLRIKNAGKIADIWQPDEIALFGLDEYNADFSSVASDVRRWRNIKYRRGIGDIVPSVSVDYMVQQLASILRVTVNTPTSAKNLRILPPIAHSVREQTITISNRNNGVLPVTDDDPTRLSNTITAGIDDILTPNEDVVITYGQKRNEQTYLKDWNYLINTLNVRQDVVLKFPDNFPADVFLCNVVDGRTIEFLGGYSFNKSEFAIQGETYNNNTGECVTLNEGVITGKPLAGRSVDVPFGSHIVLLTRKDYCHSVGDPVTYYYKNDWAFDLPDYSYTLTIKGTEDMVQTRGSIVRLADNLPDITFIELLKAIGYVTGKQLNYDDENGITFDDLNVSAWDILDVSGMVLEITDITRTFGEYAQQNNVVFEDDELLFADEQLTQQYTVQNENIAESKELARIPFSPASYIIEDGNVRAYVRNGEEETGEVYTPAKNMLLQTNGTGGDIYMHRVELTKNNGLQILCNKSTSLTAKLRMTLSEFESIRAKTTLLCLGVQYVWTEATWSGNIAKINLSKI